MDDAAPPTHHTLKPHHIDLLAVLLLLFKEYESRLPSTFILHVYRVLLNEVSEVRSQRIPCPLVAGSHPLLDRGTKATFSTSS